jgi:hypothetical protein
VLVRGKGSRLGSSQGSTRSPGRRRGVLSGAVSDGEMLCNVVVSGGEMLRNACSGVWR